MYSGPSEGVLLRYFRPNVSTLVAPRGKPISCCRQNACGAGLASELPGAVPILPRHNLMALKPLLFEFGGPRLRPSGKRSWTGNRKALL